ncbi:MAG: hypothetical protein AAFM91_16540 [Pseudomonadota bacterium]
MHDLHAILRIAHIAIGAVALVTFWLPAFTRKGSARHVRFGRWYANTMYAVAVSAMLLSTLVLIDPLAVRYPDGLPADSDPARLAAGNRAGGWFLLMLGLLVFSNVRHGRLVLAVREQRERLRTPAHLALISSPGLLGLWVASVGIRYESLLLMIFSVIALMGSAGMLWYAFRADIGPRQWMIEHFGSLIGSGIGAYTAFFAFGGASLFGKVLTGNLMVIPWVLPAIVGTIAIRALTRRYRRRFATPATASAS